MNGTAALAGEFVVAMVASTYDEIFVKGRMPLPSRYLNASLVFVMLGLLATVAGPELPAALGAGFLVAMAYKYYTPTPAAPATEGGGGGRPPLAE